MKLSALLISSAAAHTLVSKVTPVQKVLEMMGEMKAKGENMMESEAKTFRKYAEWVDDQQTQLGFEIKTGNSDVEKLSASIASADMDVTKLGKDITRMNGEIDQMEGEMKDATTLRNKESGIFVSTQQDLAESVDAIARATDVVKSGAQDKEQAMMLLQQMATTVPKMPEILAAFLEEDEVGAPASAAYKSQSGGVLSMLDSLQTKFKKELDECELEESNKRHNYELEMQHLTDTVSATKKDLSEKEGEKGKRSADSAQSNGELLETKNELASDKTLLVEVTATAATKKAMFEGNQKTRTQELAAIGKAIEIIASPDVSALQENANREQLTSLLQTQSTRSRVAMRQRVTTLLEQRAALLSSSELKAFANMVSNSPFAKVSGMIKGLITKLKEEATAEADHKQYCDTELKANKLTRQKHGTKSNQLDASVEKLVGEIDTMSKKVRTLSDEQAALTEAQSKATGIREVEKKSNTQTVADAVAGGKALTTALKVLRDFYSSQSFIQQAPDMEKFGGQQGSSKGVVGLLEVIQSDFLRLETETTATEKQAQRVYDEFMADAKKNKDTKHKEEVKLKLDKDKALNDKSRQGKDLRLTNEKLAKANKYFDTLKPTCLEIHVSFEERSARRKEEINALKDAYGMLDKKNED